MKKPALNTAVVRSRLKLKSLQSATLLKAHHPQAISLLESSGVRPGGLRRHAAKLLTVGLATTAFLTTAPNASPVESALPSASESRPARPDDAQKAITTSLASVISLAPSPLPPEIENQVESSIHQIYGIHAVSELEGNRLNTNYGYMGAEQHLPRYPGDTVEQHTGFYASGMTPGRGAWGYFAPSKSALTPDLIEKEKYYVAVQTLYLSDWQARLPYLRDWYKFRKVAVVNPKNGKAIVAVVGDSGPAAFTGKQFGGSPEVMAYLNLKDGHQKSKVVLLFVDDPQNNVPLGPLEYNRENPPELMSL